ATTIYLPIAPNGTQTYANHFPLAPNGAPQDFTTYLPIFGSQPGGVPTTDAATLIVPGNPNAIGFEPTTLLDPNNANLPAEPVTPTEAFGRGPLTAEEEKILNSVPAEGPLTAEQQALISSIQGVPDWHLQGMEPVTDPAVVAQLDEEAGLDLTDAGNGFRWFQKNGRYFTPGYVVYDYLVKPALEGQYGPWGNAGDVPESQDWANGDTGEWPGLLNAWDAEPAEPGLVDPNAQQPSAPVDPTDQNMPPSAFLSNMGLSFLRVRNMFTRYTPLHEAVAAHRATQKYVRDRDTLTKAIVIGVSTNNPELMTAAATHMNTLEKTYLNSVAPTLANPRDLFLNFSGWLYGGNRGHRSVFMPGMSLAGTPAPNILAVGTRATVNGIIGYNPMFNSSLAFGKQVEDPYRDVNALNRFLLTVRDKATFSNAYLGTSSLDAFQAGRNLGIEGYSMFRNASLMARIFEADSREEMGAAFENFGRTVAAFTLGEAGEKLFGDVANRNLRGPLMDLINGTEGPGTRRLASFLRVVTNVFGIGKHVAFDRDGGKFKTSNQAAFAEFLQIARGNAEITGWETGGAIGGAIFDMLFADTAYEAGVAFYDQMSETYFNGEDGWHLLGADTAAQQLGLSAAMASMQRFYILAGALEKYELVSELTDLDILNQLKPRSGSGSLHALADNVDEAQAGFLKTLAGDVQYEELKYLVDDAIVGGNGKEISQAVLALQDYVEDKAKTFVDDVGSNVLKLAAKAVPEDAARAARAFRAFATGASAEEVKAMEMAYQKLLEGAVEAADEVVDVVDGQLAKKGFKEIAPGVLIDVMFLATDFAMMMEAETPEDFGRNLRNVVEQTVATSGGIAAASIVSTIYAISVPATGGGSATASPLAVTLVAGAAELGTSITLDYALNHLDELDALEAWGAAFKEAYFPDKTLTEVLLQREGPVSGIRNHIRNSWDAVTPESKAQLTASILERKNALSALGIEYGEAVETLTTLFEEGTTAETDSRFAEAREALNNWFWGELDEIGSGFSQLGSGIGGFFSSAWSAGGNFYTNWIGDPASEMVHAAYDALPPGQKAMVDLTLFAGQLAGDYAGYKVSEWRAGMSAQATEFAGNWIAERAEAPLADPNAGFERGWTSGAMEGGVNSLAFVNDMTAFVADFMAEGIGTTEEAVTAYLITHPESRETLETFIDEGTASLAEATLLFVAAQEARDGDPTSLYEYLANPDDPDAIVVSP
ncbi:MAG: hypothetical protein KDI98_08675, partial [Hyphomicrobiaceae bacterium]|nr:hypothetical protein [Hyphomicrobiaceae bacterium]